MGLILVKVIGTVYISLEKAFKIIILLAVQSCTHKGKRNRK